MRGSTSLRQYAPPVGADIPASPPKRPAALDRRRICREAAVILRGRPSISLRPSSLCPAWPYAITMFAMTDPWGLEQPPADSDATTALPPRLARLAEVQA